MKQTLSSRRRESGIPLDLAPESHPICDNCKQRLPESQCVQRGFNTVMGIYKSQSFAPYFTLCRCCAQALPEPSEADNSARTNKVYWAYKDKAPDYGKGD